MIICHLCGRSFKTVEDFEQHIDNDCTSMTQEDTIEYIGTQILHPNGTSEFKKLYPKPSDEFLQRKKPDKDFTEPESTISPSALEEACSQVPIPSLI
jgi:hypothetical protein